MKMCHPAILTQTNSLLILTELNVIKNILKLHLFLNIVRGTEMETGLEGRSMFYLKSNLCCPNNNNVTFQTFFSDKGPSTPRKRYHFFLFFYLAL